MKRILIAIDDSHGAEKVAAYGCKLGKQLDAAIALISIVDSNALATDGGVTPRELAAMRRKDYENRHQQLLETVFKGHDVETMVDEGHLAEGILKAAERWQSDMIVVGTHGRTGISHMLMGSVAEKVVRHSVKPVFVVPSKSNPTAL